MPVPDTLKYKVEQDARDFVIWALEFESSSADKKKILVPRKGRFDDGSEIRDNRPEPPFALVNNAGTATKTGTDSTYVANSNGDVFYLAPYRTMIEINGYGRETAEWLYRCDILANRYTEGAVTFIGSDGEGSGIRDLSALVEDDSTFEARYQVELVATFIAKLERSSEGVPAQKIEATLNPNEEDKLVEQTL